MPTPFKEGNPGAKICFLAEAPAGVEMKMGRPLVGPSGRLYNELLHDVGLIRTECFILNVWEEQVYKKKSGNDTHILDSVGDLLWTGKKGFTEKGLEMAEGCIRRLEGCDANVIVPMGGVALSLLFGDSRISKWRGSILRANSKYIQGTNLVGMKLVPTYHPAFILHGQYLARYTVTNDLRRVKEESVTSKINLPKRELIIDPSYVEVMAFLRDLRKKKRFAHDIEVLNSQISCMCYAPSRDISMCVPLLDRSGRDNRWTEEQETEIWLAHQRLMADPDIQVINQAILFDSSFEFEQNNIYTDLKKVQCTMTAFRVIYTDFPKGLDYICSVLTREPYYKDDGKIWKKPWVDIERFWRYNALDGAIALEAWEEMEADELQDPDWQHTYQMTVDLFPVLTYMMIHGIKVDRERLEETKQDVKEAIDTREAKLEEMVGHPLNVGSSKQMRAHFYGDRAIKPYVSRKTGQPTLDDKALAAIFKRYRFPEAKLAQEIRTFRTLYSNFFEIKFDPDDMLRCSIDATGARTGRLSTSETVRGTGHNIQNIPDGFRGFLVAE